MFKTLLILVSLLLITASQAFAAEDIAVIVNKENNNAIDRAVVRKIYLGSASRWASGGAIVALDQPEDSAPAATFAAKVIGKSVAAIKDIWAQNVFTGKAIPPKVLPSDEEVKRMVARSKNAIGYIKSSSADTSVKVILNVR